MWWPRRATSAEALAIQLGPPVVFVAPTWCGDPEHGEAQTAPFRSLGTLLADTVQTIPYGVALTTFDGYLVNGQRVFMETCSVPTAATAPNRSLPPWRARPRGVAPSFARIQRGRVARPRIHGIRAAARV